MAVEGWLLVAAIDILSDKGSEYPWIKLHTGSPGAAGTANAAGNTTRKQATWGTPVIAGDSLSAQMAWTADLEWLAVGTSEDYTHITGWSLATGGVPGWSGQLTADAVVAGNDFRIPAGAYILRQPIATT